MPGLMAMNGPIRNIRIARNACVVDTTKINRSQIKDTMPLWCGLIEKSALVYNYLLFLSNVCKYTLFLVFTLIYTPEQLRANPRLFNHSDEQWQYEQCDDDMQVVAAGRRGGKTHINARKLVKAALSQTAWADWRGFVSAPTRQQAKDLYWSRLKSLVPKELVAHISEVELFIRLKTNAELHVEGLDKMARIEGQPWNYMIVDETDDTKYDEIQEHIFPMQSDRQAPLVFSGVPNGRTMLYQLSKQYPLFTWKSADVFPLYMGKATAQKMIANAKSRMDARMYRQEYEASFETLEGRIYYAFNRNVNVKQGLRDMYDPRMDIVFAFDFNVSPGTAGIGFVKDGIDYIIGEVHIPKNSNTPAVCRKLIDDWGEHEGMIYLYGDPSGGNRSTQKATNQGDWEVVMQELAQHFNVGQLRQCVATAHPPVRDSINSTNARWLSADGKVSAYIDESCEWTIEDFESVVALEGSAGEIDKSDLALTHHSDAWRYYFHYEYPIRGKTTVSEEWL